MASPPNAPGASTSPRPIFDRPSSARSFLSSGVYPQSDPSFEALVQRSPLPKVVQDRIDRERTQTSSSSPSAIAHNGNSDSRSLSANPTLSALPDATMMPPPPTPRTVHRSPLPAHARASPLPIALVTMVRQLESERRERHILTSPSASNVPQKTSDAVQPQHEPTQEEVLQEGNIMAPSLTDKQGAPPMRSPPTGVLEQQQSPVLSPEVALPVEPTAASPPSAPPTRPLHSSPLSSSPRSLKSAKPPVTLHRWYIKLLSGRDLPVTVQVEGWREKAGGGEEHWHSSNISERIDDRHLKTMSGAIYILEGPFNEVSVASMREGWSERVKRAFQNGFPSNWRELLAEDVRNKPVTEESVEKRKTPVRPLTPSDRMPALPEHKLGPGWTFALVPRLTSSRVDKHWFSPEGKKFRTLTEAIAEAPSSKKYTVSRKSEPTEAEGKTNVGATCPQCQTQLPYAWLLPRHLKENCKGATSKGSVEGEEKGNECPHCHKTFAERRSVKRHVMNSCPMAKEQEATLGQAPSETPPAQKTRLEERTKSPAPAPPVPQCVTDEVFIDEQGRQRKYCKYCGTTTHPSSMQRHQEKCAAKKATENAEMAGEQEKVPESPTMEAASPTRSGKETAPSAPSSTPKSNRKRDRKRERKQKDRERRERRRKERETERVKKEKSVEDVDMMDIVQDDANELSAKAVATSASKEAPEEKQNDGRGVEPAREDEATRSSSRRTRQSGPLTEEPAGVEEAPSALTCEYCGKAMQAPRTLRRHIAESCPSAPQEMRVPRAPRSKSTTPKSSKKRVRSASLSTPRLPDLMPRSRKKKRTSSTAKKKSDEEDVDRGQARGEEKAESNSDGETPMEDPVEAEEGEKKDRRDNGDQDEQGGGVGGQHGPSEGLHGEQGGETVGQKEEGNEKQKTGENADQGGQQHGGGMDELMEFNSDDFLDVDLGLGLDAYHDSFPLEEDGAWEEERPRKRQKTAQTEASEEGEREGSVHLQQDRNGDGALEEERERKDHFESNGDTERPLSANMGDDEENIAVNNQSNGDVVIMAENLNEAEAEGESVLDVGAIEDELNGTGLIDESSEHVSVSTESKSTPRRSTKGRKKTTSKKMAKATVEADAGSDSEDDFQEFAKKIPTRSIRSSRGARKGPDTPYKTPQKHSQTEPRSQMTKKRDREESEDNEIEAKTPRVVARGSTKTRKGLEATPRVSNKKSAAAKSNEKKTRTARKANEVVEKGVEGGREVVKNANEKRKSIKRGSKSAAEKIGKGRKRRRDEESGESSGETGQRPVKSRRTTSSSLYRPIVADGPGGEIPVDDFPTTRRSGRHHVPPLAFWMGQNVGRDKTVITGPVSIASLEESRLFLGKKRSSVKKD